MTTLYRCEAPLVVNEDYASTKAGHFRLMGTIWDGVQEMPVRTVYEWYLPISSNFTWEMYNVWGERILWCDGSDIYRVPTDRLPKREPIPGFIWAY